MEAENWYLKIIEADEVGSLGVVLHKAQDSTALLGPVSAALRQGQEELGHSCGHGLPGKKHTLT